MNLLDDFYLPLLDQEKHYLSKEYKLLKKNKIDTAPLVIEIMRSFGKAFANVRTSSYNSFF